MIIEHKDKSFSNIYKSGKLKVSFFGGVAHVSDEGLELLKKTSDYANMTIRGEVAKEETKKEQPKTEKKMEKKKAK